MVIIPGGPEREPKQRLKALIHFPDVLEADISPLLF